MTFFRPLGILLLVLITIVMNPQLSLAETRLMIDLPPIAIENVRSSEIAIEAQTKNSEGEWELLETNKSVKVIGLQKVEGSNLVKDQSKQNLLKVN